VRQNFSDGVQRAYRPLSVKPDDDQRLLCRIVMEHTGDVTLNANQEPRLSPMGYLPSRQ
jgi:hypothetical protein